MLNVVLGDVATESFDTPYCCLFLPLREFCCPRAIELLGISCLKEAMSNWFVTRDKNCAGSLICFSCKAVRLKGCNEPWGDVCSYETMELIPSVYHGYLTNDSFDTAVNGSQLQNMSFTVGSTPDANLI